MQQLFDISELPRFVLELPSNEAERPGEISLPLGEFPELLFNFGEQL